jgi:aminoglycoside phosphotransferase (APT) family kinase protein
MTSAAVDAVSFPDDGAEDRLLGWLVENVPGFTPPLVVEKFPGGQSNPTYKLITPDRTYVMRRKPPGPLLKGAHAVEREAEILQKLGAVGYPVPQVHALCTDDAVIGSWFYVMELVEGRIFWKADFEGVSNDERPAYFDAMNATLARLHDLDPQQVGLSGFGRSGNYLERQVRRWSAQYLADADAGRDPNMDRLIAWLPQNIPPEGESRIIHGDFRCDNMIFHPSEPRIVAVIDWELSTIGDPVCDFAFHAMMYRMPSHIVAGLAGVDLKRRNIVSEQEYVAAYCRRTGRAGIDNWEFYLAFNFFRLAAIFHGIKGRAIRGSASSESAHKKGALYPELAAIGWQLAAAA